MRSLCSQSLRWSPESDISLEEDCWRFKQSHMTDSINSSIWDFTAKWKSFYYQTLQKQYKTRSALPKLTETILEFTEELQGCCQVVAKVVSSYSRPSFNAVCGTLLIYFIIHQVKINQIIVKETPQLPSTSRRISVFTAQTR